MQGHSLTVCNTALTTKLKEFQNNPLGLEKDQPQAYWAECSEQHSKSKFLILEAVLVGGLQIYQFLLLFCPIQEFMVL